MKSKKRKQFTTRMSFGAAELRAATLSMYGGINLPVPKSEDVMYKEFGLEKKAVSSFGWLGNSPEFYPDINSAKDIYPKEEDFIRVPFRLISATIVGAGSWKCTDFSNVAALKKSTKMLEGKPLYKDHETDLDNWVGFVEGVKWSDSFVNASDGVSVPAGIDGIVVVDAKTNPKVARGLLMGTVFSNSVTVEFNWEMSHEFENEYDFNRNIGTLGKDGKMVRRVVTKVNNYHESSLVWLGSDPFAKAIDENGTLKHIDVTAVVEYSKLEEGTRNLYEQSHKFAVGYEIPKSVVYLTKRSEEKVIIEQPKEINMDKIRLAIIAAFGLAKDVQLTEDEIVSYIGKMDNKEGTAFVGLSKKAGAFDKLSKVTLQSDAGSVEVVTLNAEDVTEISDKGVISLGGKEVALVATTHLKSLNDKITELTPFADAGRANINFKREEVKRLYKVAVGADKADAAVLESFDKAEPKALDGFLAQYTKGATEKFTATCKSCKGTEIEFRSTVAEEETPASAADEGLFVVTSEDLQQKFGKTKVFN